MWLIKSVTVDKSRTYATYKSIQLSGVSISNISRNISLLIFHCDNQSSNKVSPDMQLRTQSGL